MSDDFLWLKKKRLKEQLNFFNADKKGFISDYAKKPRILMKEKKQVNDFPVVDNHRYLREMREQQLNRGMQHSSIGYRQAAMLDMAMRQSALGHQQIAVHRRNEAAQGQLGFAAQASMIGFSGRMFSELGQARAMFNE